MSFSECSLYAPSPHTEPVVSYSECQHKGLGDFTVALEDTVCLCFCSCGYHSLIIRNTEAAHGRTEVTASCSRKHFCRVLVSVFSCFTETIHRVSKVSLKEWFEDLIFLLMHSRREPRRGEQRESLLNIKYWVCVFQNGEVYLWNDGLMGERCCPASHDCLKGIHFPHGRNFQVECWML